MSSDFGKRMNRWLRAGVDRLASQQHRWRRGELFATRAPGGGNRSLVGRLLAALVVTSLCIYVAAVAGLWWSGGRLIEDSARKQAVQWLAELDELGTPIYATRRPEPAMRALSARLKNVPEIIYVRYYDASGGRVLGEYTARAREPRLALTAETLSTAPAKPGNRPYQLAELDGARVRVTAPVQVRVLAPDALLDLAHGPARESMKVIGFLDFVFDAGAQQAQFERSLIGGSLALALVFGVAVVLGRRKIRRAMAPLTELQEPLARLARGDIDVDMSKGGGDREIAAIREALNVTITALKERADALRRAECDALTGLVNQRYFKRQLALERSHVERDGETSAVLCIDLDRFRAVNDVVGDAAGDRLLIQVAGLLRARIRDNDLLARFEGDEFIALIRGVNRDGAVKVARSINHVVQEFQFAAGEERFPVTVSIGIAMLDASQPTAEVALAQAAAACALAKTRGGNRHQVHDGDEAKLSPDSNSPAWSRYIQTAIQDNALKFVYQPILGLHDDAGEMYELLLRLVAPGGELVSPTAFLPVADRFGLLAELDHWVIRRACEELARVRAGGRSATFFVNLSGHVFEEGEVLMRIVGEELARHKLPGEHLVFEITEQAAIRQLDRARAVVEGIGKLGCRFALDDFGSGFSSLNYLKHLPAAFIKISGTFVHNMMSDALDEVMVRSIVQIANALGMQTVAESVEDRETLQRIAELGVSFAQGHAIARPAEALPDPGFFASHRWFRARTGSSKVNSSGPLVRSARKR